MIMRWRRFSRALRCAIGIILCVGIIQPVFARQEHGGADSGETGHQVEEKGHAAEEVAHSFPHPFFNHLGMPDKPGMLSVRVTGYRQGYSEEPSRGDFAFHLETGLYDRLGLHIRNDAIKEGFRTDVMLMFTVLQDIEMESGVSVFLAGEVPSGTIPEGEDDVIGAFGIAARKVFGEMAIFDGNVHYVPKEEMVEYEVSGVLKATQYLFPVLELEGEVMEDESSLYLLPAMKFKLDPGRFLGVGSQIALTSDREFDTRALLQLDMDW